MLPIILASSSIYRKALLQRLNVSFSCISPRVDESPKPYETPHMLAQRLAIEKASAIANTHPNHLIIGSDQVACIDQHLMGKPNCFEQAFKQLTMASGKTVSFYTGLCLLNSATNQQQTAVVPFHVHFRELSETTIKRYLAIEEPYDCAGSFKAEGLGICLFKATKGSDPTSLMGLPLITLVDMLQQEQVAIP